MSNDTEMTIPEDAEIAAQEWTYDEIADKPALVAELHDCELRANFAKFMALEAHHELALQVKRASDAMYGSGCSSEEFYRFGRDRFGLSKNTLYGYRASLTNPLMAELVPAQGQAQPFMNTATYGALGWNRDQPDVMRRVARGEIPLTSSDINRALAEARRAEREAVQEEFAQAEKRLMDREEELDALRADMEQRETILRQQEDELQAELDEIDELRELRDSYGEAVDAALQERERELKRQVIEDEKDSIKKMRERLATLEAERKDTKEKLDALEKKFTSTTDPDNIRRKWRTAGEAMVTELGRFNANLPSTDAQRRFEGRDWNLLTDLLGRMKNLIPLMESMLETPNAVDENGTYHLAISGKIVESDNA